MTLNKFIELTIQNGGCTFSLWSGDTNPEHGYMTAIIEQSMTSKEMTQQFIREFINEHGHLLAESENYLSSWYDSDTKLFHLDVCELVEDELDAIIKGRMRNQIAIWDNKNAKEIRL